MYYLEQMFLQLLTDVIKIKTLNYFFFLTINIRKKKKTFHLEFTDISRIMGCYQNFIIITPVESLKVHSSKPSFQIIKAAFIGKSGFL